MRKQLEYLSKTQFVSCLSGRQLSLFFEKIKDSVKDHYKTYEAGEHLFRENDDSGSGLFLIKEGEVKVRDTSNHTTVAVVNRAFVSGILQRRRRYPRSMHALPSDRIAWCL